MIIKTCDVCTSEFKTHACKIKEGKGKHCSRKCYELYKRGKPAWNKGVSAVWMIGNKHRLGKANPNPHKMFSTTNNNWKGDKVGYRALHYWVERQLGKPSKCEKCSTTNGRFHWANKSHKYLRDIADWLRLCVKCHKAYDAEYGG